MTKPKEGLLFRYVVSAILAGVILAVDQVVKHRILEGGVHTYLNGQLAIGPFYNQGIAFSISLPNVLLGLAIFVSLVFVFWLTFFELTKKPLLATFAFGFVLGGSVGNVVDRLRFGAVIDYVHVFRTSVFNFADVCIAAGLFIIVILLFQKKTTGNLAESKS